tara:strand:+ start:123950 stop:124210 length:261 start_codon:yes stop_codon:yes gene_type:complete
MEQQLAQGLSLCQALPVNRFVCALSSFVLALGCAGPSALTIDDPATAPAPTTMPEIRGVDQEGTEFSLESALEKGPVVVIFYRGHW